MATECSTSLSTTTSKTPSRTLSLRLSLPRAGEKALPKLTCSNPDGWCAQAESELGPSTALTNPCHDSAQFTPAEVLQTIFSLALEPSCSNYDLVEKNLIRTTIVSCSQVCQSWRFAARGYSILWVHAADLQFFKNYEVIKDFLKLSEPHLIDIGHRSAPFRVHRSQDLRVLDLLWGHAHRIREWNIEYCIGYRVEYDPTWLFSSQGTSNVETFRWAGPISTAGGDDSFLLLSKQLRKLSIQHTDFPIHRSASTWDQLTELSIRNVNTKLPVEQWLQLLQSTPHLEFLSLHDAIQRRPNAISPIELPHLRVISLGDKASISAITRILRHVKIPFTCAVDLGLPSLNSRPPALAVEVGLLFLGRFAASHSHGMKIPQLELSIKPRSSTYPMVLGTVHSPESELDWNHPKGGTKKVSHYLESIRSSSLHSPSSVGVRKLRRAELVQACVAQAALIGTSTIFRITVEDPHIATQKSPEFFTSKGGFPFLLQHMRRLTTLVLDEGAILTVLPAIQGLNSPNPSSSSGLISRPQPISPAPLLPALKLIQPENANLDSDSPAARILQPYVEWRRKIGYPVNVLSFGVATSSNGEEFGCFKSSASASKRRGMVGFSFANGR